MREILFRGKCLSCKKFKHGDLVHIDNETEINALSFFNSGGCCCDEVVHVDTDTVGQYTGLKDKNGVKVFEGDIVRDITERYLNKEEKFFGIAVVKFGKHDVQSDDPFCYGEAYGWYFDGNTVRETPIQYYGYSEYEKDERYQFEVIGNIFDNRLEDFK